MGGGHTGHERGTHGAWGADTPAGAYLLGAAAEAYAAGAGGGVAVSAAADDGGAGAGGGAGHSAA